jgi:hypothetical protein
VKNFVAYFAIESGLHKNDRLFDMNYVHIKRHRSKFPKNSHVCNVPSMFTKISTSNTITADSGPLSVAILGPTQYDSKCGLNVLSKKKFNT